MEKYATLVLAICHIVLVFIGINNICIPASVVRAEDSGEEYLEVSGAT